MSKCIQLVNSNSHFIVDDEDYRSVNKIKWKMSHTTIKGKKYPVILDENRNYSLNIYLYSTTLKLKILHINGDTLDFRRDNIEYVSPKRFMDKTTKDNSRTGFLGITYECNRFRYQVKKSKKVANKWEQTCFATGSCSELFEAIVMYNYYSIKSFGKDAVLHKTGLTKDEEGTVLIYCLKKYGTQAEHASKSAQGSIRTVSKTSKYVDVYYSVKRGQWVMDIKFGNKRKSKYCETENEAALAYNDQALEWYGEYAKLNVIN